MCELNSCCPKNAYSYNQLHCNTNLIVSESDFVYDTSRSQNSFNRDEFKDLTQNEIEKLAEYAKFIKSLKT